MRAIKSKAIITKLKNSMSNTNNTPSENPKSSSPFADMLLLLGGINLAVASTDNTYMLLAGLCIVLHSAIKLNEK